jgi:hypothetical protein
VNDYIYAYIFVTIGTYIDVYTYIVMYIHHLLIHDHSIRITTYIIIKETTCKYFCLDECKNSLNIIVFLFNVYIYMYACIYLYVLMYIYVCKCVCKYVCICIYMNIYICI